MAKSTPNIGKRIIERKSIKTIYTSGITTFYFGLCLWLLQSACECCIVFHHGKIKQIIEVLKCFWYSKAPRGVFLLIIFITIWNNVYSLAGTGGIWYNLFNSFLLSLLSPVYQVGIYLTSRRCQIIIKGNKILNSDFVVFTKLSKKTFQILHLLEMLLTDSCPNPPFLEAVNYCFCRYISPSKL